MYLTVAFQPPDDFEPLARRLIKLFNHPKPFVTDPLEAFVPFLQFSVDAEQFLVRMGGRGGARHPRLRRWCNGAGRELSSLRLRIRKDAGYALGGGCRNSPVPAHMTGS